ncbi:hypothetical protein QR680_007928 [Steinernema hermaphroditum]|uniref:Uncharacterized protein n=1 Tax=Steinernema hermaphroditum TaxID=289476 RepID=A0AA39IEP4_9BILA|nr:hypothetical protein QR680_007928 [Steinernema hermaphroditum]
MEGSAEIIAVDGDLQAVMREMDITQKNSIEVPYSLLQRCQKLIRSLPDYSSFCAAMPNNFAQLSTDIIIDIIFTSRPFSNKGDDARGDHFIRTYSNMAKINGSWGKESRAIKTFTYTNSDKVKVKSFDSQGEMQTEKVDVAGLGQDKITHASFSNTDDLQDIADNLIGKLHWHFSFSSHVHWKLFMRPRFTDISIFAREMDTMVDELITFQLKSKLLRSLEVRAGTAIDRTTGLTLLYLSNLYSEKISFHCNLTETEMTLFPGRCLGVCTTNGKAVQL